MSDYILHPVNIGNPILGTICLKYVIKYLRKKMFAYIKHINL